MSSDGLHNIWLSLYDEPYKLRFLLAFMKSLANCENHSSNSLQEVVSAFR